MLCGKKSWWSKMLWCKQEKKTNPCKGSYKYPDHHPLIKYKQFFWPRKYYNQLEMKEEEKKESKIHAKEDFVKEAKMQAKRLRELIHCQPETHHRSSFQTSWHMFVHQMGNIQRQSHKRIYKLQEVSILLGHYTITWPLWPTLPRNCHQHWKI